MDPNKPASRTFTLIEILVVIVVALALLLPITPSIQQSRGKARAIQCAANLHQVGLAMRKADANDIVVSSKSWPEQLAPLLQDDRRVFFCPVDDRPSPDVISYGMNPRAYRMLGGDSHKIVMLDYHKLEANVVGAAATDDWATASAPRHRERCSVLRHDGSVAQSPTDEISPEDCYLHDKLWRPLRDVGRRFDRSGCEQVARQTSAK